MTVISERQCAHFFIYKNQKQLCNVFIYKKPDTFQKARQVPLGFFKQQSKQFTLHHVSWNLWSWHLYLKKSLHFVLCDVLFKKSNTLSKKQDNFHYVLYTKILTLFVTQLFLIFEIGRGRRGIFTWIKRHFGLYFYIQKKCP